MNDFGQVPVLTDGSFTNRDGQAILVYLTRKYGLENWLPTDAEGLAEVAAWLSTAANEVTLGNINPAPYSWVDRIRLCPAMLVRRG